MFCNYCGTKTIKNNCNNCLINNVALKEFEEEDD